MAKKRVFSGIQPSGDMHIGNYFGAILTWVREQDEKNNIFCIVDEHAITVPQDPKVLKRRTIELAKIYLAAGIDPKKSDIFVQSSRPEHTELGWILNCFTYMGELRRMTQYKEKSGFSQLETYGEDIINEKLEKRARSEEGSILKAYKETLNDPVEKLAKTIFEERLRSEYKDYIDNKLPLDTKEIFDKIVALLEERSSVGLFDYPVLMAADILLYNTDEVPVGEDQKQHVELTRKVAQRINNKFGKILVVPEYYTVKESTRIMSLQDPSIKMSKSDPNENSRIEILDAPDVIRKKFAKAVTDSDDRGIIFDPKNKPGISNLLNINAVVTNTSIDELVKMYRGFTYGEFKKDVAEAVIELLTPFQERYAKISDDEVRKVLREGAEKVKPVAEETLKRVKDAVGLGL